MKIDSPSQDSGGSAAPGPAAAPAAPAAPPVPTAASEAVVRLSDRIEILTRQRFEATDRPMPDAFKARRTDQPQNELWAIATGILPLARADTLSRLKSLDQPALLSLVDWGMVDWSDEERRLALVFDSPPGPQLMTSMDEVRVPMNEENLIRTIFVPAYNVLRDLAAVSIVHGAIRPTNFYYDPSGRGAAVLGECVSAPASFLQPLICETIELAQTEPIARGAGSVADDLYALGVTAAILSLGQNPLREMPADELIEHKIERGTYAALLGNVRFPAGLIEPLRGLLSDDQRQRWTLEDLGKWLGGRRQNARQVPSARKSQRAIQFGAAEVWNPRTLAAAMSRNIPLAVKLIQSGEIDRWLRRSLGDGACAARVEEVVSMNATSGRVGGASEDRLVARVCMALDPAGPIRYRGRAVMVPGIGAALVDAMARGATVQPLAELISAQLPLFWYSQQPEEPVDILGALRGFDQCRSMLERSGFGYGIEGVVYELVPWAPCLSDLIRRFYVMTPGTLLQALEAVAENPAKRPELPIDRHIAAFLAARDRSGGDAALTALSSARDNGQRNLAVLNMLAAVQRRHGPQEAPKLAGWVAGLMQAIIERYHNRKTREKVQMAVSATAQRGDLFLLQQLVDDTETVERDQSGFRQAQASYKRLSAEISGVTRYALDRAQLEATVGRETAAIVATAVALLLAAGIVIMGAAG